MIVLRTFDAARERYGDLLLLHGAAPEAVAGVLGQARVLRAEAGETVLEADQPNSRVYVLLSGTLRVDLAESRDGVASTHIGRGECVGELSVIDGATTSARVRAVDTCELLLLSGEEVTRLAEHSHAVAMNLLRLLSRRIRGANHLVRERAIESETLRARSTMDALTGLYNRRWLDETLGRMTTRAEHAGGAKSAFFGFLLADVDHFKRVNDEHGHLVGDRVLQKVSEAVRLSLRPTDFAARYGGEEIAAVIPELASLETAAQIAERVRRAVRAVEFIAPSGAAVPLSISLGVAILQPGESVESLIARADAALYRAKREGRDRVVTAQAST